MTRLIALLALVLASLSVAMPARAADDISAVSRSVVRVVTVAMVDGEGVGFGHGSGIAITPTRSLTNAHVVDSAAKYPQNENGRVSCRESVWQEVEIPVVHVT